MKRMNMQNIYRIFPLIFLLLTSCRGDEPVPAPREITVSSGFYLLNEGNKGNNMATLDYFDYTNICREKSDCSQRIGRCRQ